MHLVLLLPIEVLPKELYRERNSRPAAIRDIVSFPADIRKAESTEDFDRILNQQNLLGNNNYLILGLKVEATNAIGFSLSLTENSSPKRLEALAQHIKNRFSKKDFNLEIDNKTIKIKTKSAASLISNYLNTIKSARNPIELSKSPSST